KVTTNISPDIFKSFSLSESQKEYFEDATEKTVDSDIKIRYNMFSLFSKKEISSGDANSYNYDIFSTLVLGYGLHDIAPVFSFGICAIMLVMFCSLLLLFAALYGFATGHRFASGIVIPAKIISIFMAVVVLALSIVACAVAEINVDPIGITYSPAIAYGPILMLVAAVAVTAVPKTRP
ncbi:MAG: hypothetical protein J6S10_02805, partial [Clostridia bacterium]|nr:hypothetical protein [Clostridia bacterium]